MDKRVPPAGLDDSGIADLLSAGEFVDAVLATAHDAILCKDLAGRIISWNAGAERLYGHRAPEILGQSVTRLVPERLHGEARAWFERLPQEIHLGKLRTRCLRKDGSEFPAELSLRLVQASGGKIVLGMVRDVSDYERAQSLLAELRLSEERFRYIARAATDALWDWDIEKGTLWWGEGILGRFGYSPEELERGLESWTSRIHPADREDVLTSLQAALDRGEDAYVGEYRFQRKDGGYAFVLDRGFVIRDPAGRPIRMVGGMTDLSERLEAQARLRKHAEQLARSNEELERFAYVISHDLQEPLRTLASYAQLLRRRFGGHSDRSAEEFTGYITEGVQRMRGMIDGLLAYSRIAQQARALQPTDLNQVLQDVQSALQAAMADAAAQVSHEPLPTLNADPQQMRQLFQNLVGNAIKFRRPDVPPRIHIEAQPQGDDWLITVGDNGIGIEPRFAERIFILFQRLHAREEYPGSGIGLAICKKIVSAHGGRIWVEPAGSGARFRFTLPTGGPAD